VLSVNEEVEQVQKKFFTILLTFILLLISAQVFAAGTVTDINYGINRNNVLRFTIDVTEKAPYSISIDDKTLVVTVKAQAAPGLVRKSYVKGDMASKMTVDRDGDKTILKVALRKEITEQQYKSFNLKKDPRTGRPDRIVVDITANERAARSSYSGRSSSVQSIDFKTSGGIKDKTITLDPGHGGSDPGAIGKSGTREKNITLQITQRIQKYLQDAGAKVNMTRTNDVDVYGPNASDRAELQARVDVGTAHKSDAFISIHINANNSPSVGGFSTYYTPKTGYDYKLARCIHTSIVKGFGLDDLGVRQAGFYVTKHSLMPAVLIENCFITNPREEKLLQSSWFQNKIAKTIADGIIAYFN
jgi:N-acetylmuramoyl-L-alanine amidase